jgi:hypothetical protein
VEEKYSKQCAYFGIDGVKRKLEVHLSDISVDPVSVPKASLRVKTDLVGPSAFGDLSNSLVVAGLLAASSVCLVHCLLHSLQSFDTSV